MSGWQLFLVDFNGQSWKKSWNSSFSKQGKNHFIMKKYLLISKFCQLQCISELILHWKVVSQCIFAICSFSDIGSTEVSIEVSCNTSVQSNLAGVTSEGKTIACSSGFPLR